MISPWPKSEWAQGHQLACWTLVLSANSTVTSRKLSLIFYSTPLGVCYRSGTNTFPCSSKYKQESSATRAGFQSSVHDKYQSNAQAYDKSLLQKLDARRTSDNTTPPRGYSKSAFSTSASDSSPTSRIAFEHRYPNTTKPLSLPIITSRGLVESPLSQWADTPLSSISPSGSYPYHRFGPQSQFDHRSPSDTVESDRSPLPYIRRSESSSVMSIGDDASSVTSRSRESYDHGVSPEHDVDFQMEEAGLRRLHLDDYSARSDAHSPGSAAGQKRRASSPPSDDGPSLHTVGSASDLYRRRESASRTFHSNSGSVSSTASAPRSGSYVSTLSAGGSSITSLNSYGRLSPGGISPGGSDMADSPYVTSLSLNPSPRGSLSRTNHNRTISETRPLITSRKLSDSLNHSKQNSTPKMQGVFMCECCPKKPKKFDSQEELK